MRLKDRSGQFRFFYYVKKRDGIYFIHAFKKKTQELPKKEIELKGLAKTMNVSLEDAQEKQRLINKIIALRLQKDLSQVQFAKMVGVTQSRIAQIESGAGTRTVSFDVLFHLLQILGFRVEVRLKKIAA